MPTSSSPSSSSSKKRPSELSLGRRKITKHHGGGVSGKSRSKRRYWFRGDPCFHATTASARPSVIFGKSPKAAARRAPRYAHLVHADRLLPFRPKVTLNEAAERQNALAKLRETAEKNKVSAPALRYYVTALQGEVLKAPLTVRVERDRKVLEAQPDEMLMNFSKMINLPTPICSPCFSHPLENGTLCTAFGREEDLFSAERPIAKVPYKILDAPDLKDDFYYNLIDWSSKDILGVGLGKAVYMWTATTSYVEELNIGDDDRDEVSSISWSQGASALAVGGRQGSLKLWDPETKIRIITFLGQTSRVGSLSWNLNMLLSGSRDGSIRYFDHRQSSAVSLIKGHRSEVCGLKWSRDNFHFASGGNDNRVNVWDIRRPDRELWKITDHTAAVKALSWSPHNNKFFVTGGGLKDLTIKMWNLNTMECVMDVDADAQVCGLHWSETVNEIVSTHGYNNNGIRLWKASNMECMASVPGNSTRIVYLTASPDGQSIATGSGDESIRFYKIFPPANNHRREDPSMCKDKVNTTIR